MRVRRDPHGVGFELAALHDAFELLRQQDPRSGILAEIVVLNAQTGIEAQRHTDAVLFEDVGSGFCLDAIAGKIHPHIIVDELVLLNHATGLLINAQRN